MIYEALLENCKRYFVFKMIASQKVDNGNNLDLSRGPSTLSILYCVNSELSHYDLFKRKTMNFGVLLCTADEGREIILKATFISCPFTKSPKKYTVRAAYYQGPFPELAPNAFCMHPSCPFSLKCE